MYRRLTSAFMILSMILTALDTNIIWGDTGDEEPANEFENAEELSEVDDGITSGTCGEGLSWSLSGSEPDLTLTISGSGDMYDFDTSNPPPWSGRKKEIKKLVLNPGIKNIGEYAFSGISLKNPPDIPFGVTKIGRSSFGGCGFIGEISLPDGLDTIGAYAFDDCRITGLSLPSSLKIIEDNALGWNNEISSVSFPEGLEYLGSENFPYLKRAVLPDNALVHPEAFVAFYPYRQNLEYIRIGKNTLFGIYDGLKNKSYTDSYEKYYDHYTSSQYSGEGSWYCPKLISRNLTEIEVDTENSVYCSKDGVLFYKNGKVLLSYPGGKSITEYTVPRETDIIASLSFSGAVKLKSIIIKEGCCCVEPFVFNIGATQTIGNVKAGLNSVVFPKSLKSLGNGLFNTVTAGSLTLYYGGSQKEWEMLTETFRATGEDDSQYVDTILSIPNIIYDSDLSKTNDTDKVYGLMENDLFPYSNRLSLSQSGGAVITDDGSLYTWGANAYGELGNNKTDDKFGERVPQKIMSDMKYVKRTYLLYSGGGSQTAAISKDNKLYGWGAGGHNAFLLDDSRYVESPRLIKDDIAAYARYNKDNYNMNAALSPAGDLYTWGVGYLGHGGDDSDGYERSGCYEPEKALTGIREVSPASGFTAVSADGDLYMCGPYNIGVHINTVYYDTTAEPLRVRSGVSHCAAINGFANVIITDKNELCVWGADDRNGVLGLGTENGRALEYTKILDNVKYYKSDYSVAAAVTNDGKLYMWGENNRGQLGTGDTRDRYAPVEITKIKDVEYVDIVRDKAMAITKNGDLYAWGYGEYGLLGQGEKNGSYEPQRILTNVKYAAFSSGDSNGRSCAAILENDDLYVWGSRPFGDLDARRYADAWKSCMPFTRVMSLKEGGMVYDPAYTPKVMTDITGIEISAFPSQTSLQLSEDLNTEGLRLRVTYSDGTTREISSGFTVEIKNRGVGLNDVVVSYGGFTVTYQVDVSLDYYLVTATAVGNGRVSPEGVIKVSAGGSKLFEFIPDEDYEVAMVDVDGNIILGRNTDYMLKDVTEDMEIRVYFQRKTDPKELFTKYSDGLRKSNSNQRMYNEIMEEMTNVMNDYTGNALNTWMSAARYCMKNAEPFSLIKLAIEGYADLGWTEDELQDEMTRELVYDLSENEGLVYSVLESTVKILKFPDDYYKLLQNGVRAEDENRYFEKLREGYKKWFDDHPDTSLKDVSVEVKKSEKFKTLESIFKAKKIAVKAADIITLAIQMDSMNQDIISVLYKNTSEGSMLYRGLERLIGDMKSHGLLSKAMELIEDEVIDKKIFGNIADTGVQCLGEWITKNVYGIGEYKGTGISVKVAGSIFKFGRYLLYDWPDADELIKARLAVDNMITLDYAFNHKRDEAYFASQGKDVIDPFVLETWVMEDQILYKACLTSLDSAYEYVCAAIPESKTKRLKEIYGQTRKKLTYDNNISASIAAATAVWVTGTKASGVDSSDHDSDSHNDFNSGKPSDGIEITGVYINNSDREYYLDIPSEIDGEMVGSVGNRAFAGNNSLTGVYIPSGVEIIGNGAFSDCSNLVRAYLEDGLKEIGSGAFAGCDSLKTIEIPATVTYIAPDAFDGAEGVEMIAAPGSVAEIFALTTEGIGLIRGEKGIESIAVEASPSQTVLKLSEGIKTDGLKIRVYYTDGTSDVISEGMTVLLEDKKPGWNNVLVLYKGYMTTYRVEVLPDDESGNGEENGTGGGEEGDTGEGEIPKNYNSRAVVKQKLDVKPLFPKLYKRYDISPRGLARINKKGILTARRAGTVTVTGYEKIGGKWVKDSENAILIDIEKPVPKKRILYVTDLNTFIDFSSNMADCDIKPDEWRSSDESILSIDPKTGRAVAFKNGVVKVKAVYGRGKQSAVYFFRVKVKTN